MGRFQNKPKEDQSHLGARILKNNVHISFGFRVRVLWKTQKLSPLKSELPKVASAVALPLFFGSSVQQGPSEMVGVCFARQIAEVGTCQSRGRRKMGLLSCSLFVSAMPPPLGSFGVSFGCEMESPPGKNLRVLPS